ncbi:MAG: prolyl oligopeptidase family serine peptidase [Ignavibacteriaceae bacterium]
MKNLLLTILLFIPLTSIHSQDTINVPGDYTTIQSAIYAANNGDVILVAEGTYYENIKYKGKAITVASHFLIDGDTSHISNTIINGSQPSHPDSGSVVSFVNNEDTTSVLCGFTITGGTGTTISNQGIAGGGIFATFGCTIKRNKITNNTVNNTIIGRSSFGGGVGCYLYNNMRMILINNEIYNNSVSSHSSSAGGGIGIAGINDCLITDNVIYNNSVSATDIYSRLSGGGGILISGYNSEIRRNIIMNNIAPFGGAILASQACSIRLLNNTITQNQALYQGGGLYLYVGYANIMNNIIWDNTAPKDSNIFYRGYLDFNYSITSKQMTGIGNIQSDPMFTDTLYHLDLNSPAIDAGNPDELFNDFEDPFNPGFAQWPAMGTIRNDIGGYGATDSAHLPVSGFQMIDEFLPYSFPGLVYRIAYPSDYDSTQQYPLSIVLHGSGNVGNNNIDQLWIGLLWRVNAQAYGYNDFTVVPQSPTNPWSSTDLHNLIQYLISNYPIDTNRIVVTGWSMGGFAVGSLLQQFPRTFAAGIPISGVTWGNNLRNIPLWLFHGDSDNNVNVQVSRNVVNNLQQLGVPVLETENISETELDSAISAGAKFLYTEIPGSDHFIIYRIYENYYLYKWLSLTKKPSIFPDQVWTIPDGFIEPGNSIIIQSTFYNPADYSANYKAVIEDLENDTLQIIPLYDDGLHNDGLANDGIWGNISQIIPDEQILRVGIEVSNTDLNEVFYFRAMSGFTTAGPLSVDSVDISYNSTFNFYNVLPYVKNNSSVTTISNAVIELVCNDPWITTISSPQNLPDIPPGSVVTTPGYFLVSVDSTFPGFFNFKFNVSMDGLTYWSDSTSIIVGVEDVEKLPTNYALSQNYPNPFNPSTNISYSITQYGLVTIKVYNTLGEEVATLVNEEKPAGTYELTWNAANLSSGVYFYQLMAGDFIQTKKMILLR